MDDFDRLMEQQNQEIVLEGVVSLHTKAQFEAYARGEQVQFTSPDVLKRITAEFRETMKQIRAGTYVSPLSNEDVPEWFYDCDEGDDNDPLVS